MSPFPTRQRRLLEADRHLFRERFDRQSFEFGHRLSNHPLFESERLLQVAKDMARDPRDVYYDAGDVHVDQRWDQVPVCDIPIEELVRRIETANAWIVLRRAEKYPEYAALLNECIAEIEELCCRPLSRLMKLQNAIIFINSPHRVSSYHIDRECNCLLQIRGRKTISVFPRDDRDVLSEDEIERFWTIDNNAPMYRPSLQHRADVFELAPGRAVHIPVNAPHWVKNGPQTSVSLSINFHYKDRLLADVYRANYWLRRAGLKPMPPRRSLFVDRVKGSLFGSARALQRKARRLARKA